MPLVLADHAFNKDGSFRYAENVDLGFRGDTLLVNGAVSPRMAVQRRKYRLRFLNASNARSYTLRLGNGRAMMQIAGDGGLLARPVPRAGIPMHPAERVDIVIDFSDYGPGEQLVLYNTDGRWRHTGPIMRFDIEGGRVTEEFGPAAPARARAAARAQRAPALEARARHGRVADQRARVRPEPHRRAPAPRQHGDLDLRQQLQPRAPDAPARVPLPDAWSARAGRSRWPTSSAGRTRSACCPTRPSSVLAWFAPYSGKYVFHCHAFEHADKAMMLQMEIV